VNIDIEDPMSNPLKTAQVQNIFSGTLLCTKIYFYSPFNIRNLILCTVRQNFKLRPIRLICFDLVKACEGDFLLCFLGQIVTWQLNPNLLDSNWPCTVINDNDWHLWNGPLQGSIKVQVGSCAVVFCFTFNITFSGVLIAGNQAWDPII